MLLAGDIGGTNTRLALFEEGRSKAIREAALPSASFGSLEAAVKTFLGPKVHRIAAATFGIAGPVVGGRVKTTNLPWVVDEKVVARRLRSPRVRLLNDLVAIAYGASVAPKSKLAVLQGGSSPRSKGATLAVIAAGTGLGEAALVWDSARFVPCGSEGGHCDFAPRSTLEWELREYLSKKLKGRVSYERVVSGPGLGHVYDFFVDVKKVDETRLNREALAEAPDRNRLIAELGIKAKSPVAKKALEVFLGIYGAEAGNLALKFLSTGGIFIAGGIAASLLPLLKSGPFLQAFQDKGRFRPLLQKMPLAVILDSNIGLAGSAHYAATLL
jgi:glucokinase